EPCRRTSSPKAGRCPTAARAASSTSCRPAMSMTPAIGRAIAPSGKVLDLALAAVDQRHDQERQSDEAREGGDADHPTRPFEVAIAVVAAGRAQGGEGGGDAQKDDPR